jgi:hypothetical protein
VEPARQTSATHSGGADTFLRKDSFSCPEKGIVFEMDQIKDQLD